MSQYRKLKIGEVLKSTDEVCFNGTTSWTKYKHCAVGDVLEQKDVISYKWRRRIHGTKTKNIAGKGYRFLKRGETIIDGDEFNFCSGGWSPSHRVGGKVSTFFAKQHDYRRKIDKKAETKVNALEEKKKAIAEESFTHTLARILVELDEIKKQLKDKD